MNKLFTTRIKTIIGVAAIVISVIIGFVTNFAYSSNAAMTISMVIGAISLANILISKIFKINISYILYMAGNILGLIIALFVVSKAEAMGNLYMILFLVIIFVALWIYHMCIMNIEEIGKRVLAAFIGNVVSVLFIMLGTLIVIVTSVVVTMM